MKCKCGGTMRLMRLTMDTEAHVCIMCGRDNMPRKQPVSEPELDPETISTPSIRVTKIRRTCPGCGREGLKFSGKCGRCVDREKHGLDLITGKPLVTVPKPPSIQPETIAVQPKAKEPTMATKKVTPRGDCPSCNRKDVLMPGPKCSRCYDRIKKGKDVITGAPVTAQEPAPPLKAATPPISEKKAVQHKPAADACTVDVKQLLDDTWISQRMLILEKLDKTRSNYSRLEMALHYVDRLKEVGV